MAIKKKKAEWPAIKSYKDIIKKNDAIYNYNIDIVNDYHNKHSEVSSRILSIARSYSNFFEKYVRYSKVKWLKNYFMYNWDREKEISKKANTNRKSNEKTGLTKIITDLYISKIFSTDFYIQSRKRKTPEKDNKKETYSEEEIASYDNKNTSVDEQSSYLDWVFTDSQIRKWLQSCIFDIGSSGAWYALIDMNISQEYIKMNKKIWDYILSWKEKQEAERIAKNKYYKINRINNIFKYIPIFNVIYEYDKDFEDSSFVGIYIYESVDKFLNDFNFIDINEDIRNYIKSSNYYIFWKNYNKVKMIKSIENKEICWKTDTNVYLCDSKWISWWTINDSVVKIDNNLYWWYWYDEPDLNKKEFYLHYTRNTLVVMCWDTVIYDWENPVWAWIIPIIRMAKENYWDVWASLGTTEILQWVQTANDLINNSVNDSIKMMLNPKYYTNWYVNIPWFEWWSLPFEWWKIYQWDMWEIKKFDLWTFDYNALKMIDHYWQQGIMLVGLLNKYWVQYQQQRPEQTSGNGNIMLWLAQEPLKQVVNWISLWLTKAFKIRSILAQRCLPNHIKIKIEWDGWTEEERSIKIQNLLDNIDVVYMPESMVDYSFQTKINNLTQYANFLSIASTDPTSWINYSNYANLNKEFASLLGIKWWYQTKEQFFDGKEFDAEQQLEVDKKKINYDFELEKLRIEKQNQLLSLQIENQKLQQQLSWPKSNNEPSQQQSQSVESNQPVLQDTRNDVDIIKELVNKRLFPN